MSVVANSFTKNTHAERALCAQAPKATKASMCSCAPRGSSLLAGGLFSWELSSHGSSPHVREEETPPKPQHSQVRTNASCVPKPQASRNAFPSHTQRRVPLGPINRYAKRERFSIIQVQKARKKRANNSCKHEIRQRGKAEHFHTKHKRSKRRSCCRTEGCN